MMVTKQENKGSKMKPIPASDDEMSKEIETIISFDSNVAPSPRAKLYHCMISSRKSQRCLRHTMILLVGSTGAGKSSTINHLLDTGDGMPVAMTSSSNSETRMTCEYVLTVDDPDYEVSDLTLGIVDTPGFGDTGGPAQDACNYDSILEFFYTHPENPSYPNLIFLVVSAIDQRIEGRHSNLARTLNALKKLELVDKNNPNLVAILTFCCSVGHRDVLKWKERMKRKIDIISKLIIRTLNVEAPVVLLENDYDDCNKLQIDGDFTILPNGERQPKNLYNACQKLLERNSDHFGLLTLNACFTKAKKKCSVGHKVVVKDASEGLFEEEKQLLPVAGGDVVGQGYNIITDTPTDTQIIKFETVFDDQLRLSRPSCAKVVRINETHQFKEKFKDQKSYVESRLRSLNVNIDAAFSIFKMSSRAGYNASWESRDESILSEHRMLRVTIANFEKERISFTKDFQSAVNKLPDKYHIDEDSQKEYENFFNNFGHFVVSSAYAGGSVEIKTTKLQQSSRETARKMTGEVNANLCSSEGELRGEEPLSSSSKTKNSENVDAIKWRGGRSDLHERNTLNSKMKMRQWRSSLLEKPIMLTSEMNLTPISTVVSVIDESKRESCHDALEKLLQGKFDEERKKAVENSVEGKRNIKEEEIERKINTRTGRVKQPDISFWSGGFNYFTQETMLIGGILLGLSALKLIAR